MPLTWNPVDAPWTIEDIGAFLFDSIARCLYEPEEVLREYVQNAVDGLTAYLKHTALAPSMHIQVRIDAVNASMCILDRGIGMDEADIKRA
jgi:HSP90 family molecular chaperone